VSAVEELAERWPVGTRLQTPRGFEVEVAPAPAHVRHPGEHVAEIDGHLAVYAQWPRWRGDGMVGVWWAATVFETPEGGTGAGR
jgi:hypothetical protein